MSEGAQREILGQKYIFEEIIAINLMKYYWEVVKINAKTGESNARLKSGPRNKVLRGHKDLVMEQKQQQILSSLEKCLFSSLAHFLIRSFIFLELS